MSLWRCSRSMVLKLWNGGHASGSAAYRDSSGEDLCHRAALRRAACRRPTDCTRTRACYVHKWCHWTTVSGPRLDAQQRRDRDEETPRSQTTRGDAFRESQTTNNDFRLTASRQVVVVLIIVLMLIVFANGPFGSALEAVRRSRAQLRATCARKANGSAFRRVTLV